MTVNEDHVVREGGQDDSLYVQTESKRKEASWKTELLHIVVKYDDRAEGCNLRFISRIYIVSDQVNTTT